MHLTQSETCEKYGLTKLIIYIGLNNMRDTLPLAIMTANPANLWWVYLTLTFNGWVNEISHCMHICLNRIWIVVKLSSLKGGVGGPD